MKKFKLLSILLVLTLLVAACGSDDEKSGDSEEETKVYKVGVDTTYPPFEFEEAGEYKGIDIDLINAIA